jgi:hypothetical protein
VGHGNRGVVIICTPPPRPSTSSHYGLDIDKTPKELRVKREREKGGIVISHALFLELARGQGMSDPWLSMVCSSRGLISFLRPCAKMEVWIGPAMILRMQQVETVYRRD